MEWRKGGGWRREKRRKSSGIEKRRRKKRRSNGMEKGRRWIRRGGGERSEERAVGWRRGGRGRKT